jgi:hypothetical protein
MREMLATTAGRESGHQVGADELVIEEEEGSADTQPSGESGNDARCVKWR